MVRVGLTTSLIREAAAPRSFERGNKLSNADAVSAAFVDGDALTARCEGTQQPSYEVRVELDAAGVRSASCTCRHDWEGHCKHIVAVLLTYLHRPEQFTRRLNPSEVLASLSRDDLVALVSRLLRDHPDLYEWIAAEGASPADAHIPRRARKVDPEVYRRQAHNILHSLDHMRSSEAYWHTAGLVQQLDQLKTMALQSLDADDAETTLAILVPLLEEVSQAFEYIDDSDGNLSGFVDLLARPLTEAMLSIELSAGERAQLLKRLKKAAQRLSDYGMEEAVDSALHVAIHGWEEPPPQNGTKKQQGLTVAGRSRLVSLPKSGLNDEPSLDDDWDEPTGEMESEPAGDPLIEAKLNVLERQGRTEEYFALCRTSGHHLRYALKLCDLQRFDEAVAFAEQNLTLAEQAWQVAERLRAMGRLDAAVAIAEHGLNLGGSRFLLGEWLAPVEEARGRVEQALQAWRVVFEDSPSLKCYRAIERLARDHWLSIRPDLMHRLREPTEKLALVEVLVSEREWDEATMVADQDPGWYGIVEHVADGILECARGKGGVPPAESHLKWVVRASLIQAEGLVEEARSKYYPIAARWLRKVKKAYHLLELPKEWENCLAGWKQQYRRRPALQKELQKL